MLKLDACSSDCYMTENGIIPIYYPICSKGLANKVKVVQ